LGPKVWKKFGKSLEKVWKKFGKSLEKVWKKFGKSLEKFQKSSETGFSECSEISEIVLFPTFQKLQKNDV